MITLRDFLDLAMDDTYLINVYYIDGGNEIITQKEVGFIAAQLEEDGLEDLLDLYVQTWDLSTDEYGQTHFCVNIG